MKKNLMTSVCIFALLVGSIAAQVKPDGQEAWKHTKYLASDDFKGRRSGTPEYLKAAEYVAEKMKEFGLQPANKDGTYFQQVKFKNWRNFEPPIRLEIISPKSRIYFPGRSLDFSPNSGTGSGKVKGQLVFAGYGLESKKYDWDDYKDLDVTGKIVLLIPGFPEFMKDLETKEKTFENKIKRAAQKGAAGILLMNVGGESGGRRYPRGVRKGTCPEGFLLMTASIRVLDDIFYMSNLSWRHIISQTLRGKSPYNMPLDVTVEMEAHFIQDEREAPNVIGVLPGKHPQLKDEYIIIGGHLDHLGVAWDGRVYNGADDNAASVAVILEIARAMKLNNYKPDRTIIFAGWAGEELGLVGSRYYANNPLYPLEKTVVYMNMDMIGLGDDDLFVGGMWEYADFFDLLKENMQDKFKEKLNYRLNYRGSDHSAFLGKGVTSISLRTGNPLTRELDDEHPEYHKPGDDPEYIRPELLQIVGEYHYDNLVFLADYKGSLLDKKHRSNFIHKNATVADMHCDTIYRYLKGEDLKEDLPSGHIDIPKLKQGAVDLQVFACFVGPPSSEEQKHQAAKKVFNQIDAVYRLVNENPDDLELILSPDDMRNLRATWKTGVLIGIEGGYAIENDLALLRTFYRNGVRLMTLTHWRHTDWADASGDPEAKFGGLTAFGEEVVKEMNKLGMIIDVSHVHDETFWDVINISDSPIVASHSCCRALSDHHRNMSDKMLKALKKNGGVIGINYAPGFLNAENSRRISQERMKLLKKFRLPLDSRERENADPETLNKFNTAFEKKVEELRKELPSVDVKTVVDHIEHVIKVTGSSNHVGLGSDFDGIGSTPEGLEHTGNLAEITAELFKRGHKEADIRKILGGNFLRVFQKVAKKE
jgi:membrane dipeptidase